MSSEFMEDLASRLSGRIQLTTDGQTFYLNAVENAFYEDVDFAMLLKRYAGNASTRYSPAKFVSASREVIKGNPDAGHISRSFVERQNLTMRMSMRRFTRLTNGFTKKAEHHAHAVAIHFLHYNFFVRLHKTLRVTPAMAAGLTARVWSLGGRYRAARRSRQKAA